MLYRNLNYLIFIILSQLFKIIVYGQFIPGPRKLHTAIFIEPELRIFYIGGYNYNELEQDPESDFFYLNVNNTISEDFLSWVDLKSQGIKLPYIFSHNANIGGFNIYCGR